MHNSDPPVYRVEAVPQRRATITAALVGAVLGLLSWQPFSSIRLRSCGLA